MADISNNITSPICRICLLGTQESKTFMDYSPSYYVNSVNNIHINEEDTLPDRICTTCLLDLENAILKQILDDINDTETNLPELKQPESNVLAVEKEKCDDPNYLEDDLNEGFYEKHDDLSPVNNNTNKNIIQKECDISDVNNKVPSKCQVICHDCGGVFKSKCKLRVHWKTKHKIYLDCELCKARFCSMKAYKNHKLTSTERCKILNTVTIDGFGKNRTYTCPTCKYSTNRALHILQHLRIHTGERKHMCSICGKGFNQKPSLIKHEEGTHKLYKMVTTCELCGKEIEGRFRFYRHMKRFHSKRIYECDICHNKIKSRHSMINHLKIHEGVKTYRCEFCGKGFVCASYLAVHIKNVHSSKKVTKKQLSCYLCDYRSTNKRAMDAHLVRHGCDGISCDFCGKFYESEIRLWIHRLCHLPMDSVARRTCHFCGKVYLTNKSMSTHAKNVHIKKNNGTHYISEVISRIQIELAFSKQSYHRTKVDML